jgi:hypothetical protein
LQPRDDIFTTYYADGARFEDPLGNVDPRLAFKGLAALFSDPVLKRWDVVDATPQRIKVELEATYKM